MRKLYLIYAFSVLLLAGCSGAGSENETPNPESPQISEDISNQKVTSFAEDEFGHIWIGTFRGLNRFNVHEFHQYFCTDEANSLPDNQIQAVYRDSRNRLWVSTVNGMALYSDKDDFRRIPMDGPSNNAMQIFEDARGNIYINTSISLCRYDETQGRFVEILGIEDQDPFFRRQFYATPSDEIIAVTSISIRVYDPTSMELKETVDLEGFPTYFTMLPGGQLWLASGDVVYVYDTERNSFDAVSDNFMQNSLFRGASVTYIYPYGEDSVLLNTESDGLFIYNKEDGSLKHQSENGFPFVAPHEKITCMFTDSRNNLWIGTYDQGYHVIYDYKERFNSDSWLKSNIGHRSVVSLDNDSKDNLWLVTLREGLYLCNSANGVFRNFDASEIFGPEFPSKVTVKEVFVDADDNLWLTFDAGVARCVFDGSSLKLSKFWPMFYPGSLSQDNTGRIWIGSFGENLGYIMPGDDEMNSIKVVSAGFTYIPYALPLISDTGNVLSAAFEVGLCEIDGKRGHVRQIMVEESRWKECIQRSVFVPSCMYQDAQGIVWIGTVANGLMRFDLDGDRLERVPGAPCLDITSIEEDMNGYLWVSTQYGLGRYDREAERFTNWFASDGIGGNQFYDRASCRMSDGTVIFGGTHGVTSFNPTEVSYSRDIPVYFEALKVNNVLVRPQDGGCIEKGLQYSPDVNLKHYQNGFSISFAALEYGEYERVDYQYMLEGFDRHWVDASSNREASYSNVPSGKYTFKVRVTNGDHTKVIAENSIDIDIDYPWWMCWWANIIYVVVVGAVIALIARANRQMQREKAGKLKAQQEKEQERRVNQMNMNFFANISHEFRTPLTMISGPVAQLQEATDISEGNRRLLDIVQRNIHRMTRLVNQQLDFNKLENDTLKLKVKQIDVISQLCDLTDMFRVTAHEKGVQFRVYGLEDSMTVWVDDDKLDKICFNLLSNAMKFTGAGGKVEFSLDVVSREEASHLFALTDKDVDSRYMKIVVKDSGLGIPESQLEKIFERFYQLEGQSRLTHSWGTGIGLYFAKALAQLHHGYLKAGNRTTGPGAVFTLVLPLSETSYSEAEKDHLGGTESNNRYNARNVEYTDSPIAVSGEGRKKVLVVDDDADVINYLKALLSPVYEVISRFDAESAYVVIKEEAPDIIISDVVMSGKTGYELCRQIKDNIQLSHLPVILLTAKATVGDQVEGLDSGADAYVTKPFEPQYLLALIQSQLKNREKIRAILSVSTDVDEIEENALSPQDSAFMTELYQLMENELSNSELDVSRMTELLHISRTKFYYKVKGLTGENPSVFFKRYKLNRAAQLLQERKHNVSEIADMTGFSTLSHFSTSFKKQFGVSPSEYVK